MKRASEVNHLMSIHDSRLGSIFRRWNRDVPMMERENQIARRTFQGLCILDILTGLFWLVQASNRSTSSIYKPVRSLFAFLPGDAVRWWGGLLLLLGLGALLSSLGRSENRTMLFVTGLVMYWSYWVISDISGVGASHASLVAAPIAGFAVLGHMRVAASGHRITKNAYENEPQE